MKKVFLIITTFIFFLGIPVLLAKDDSSTPAETFVNGLGNNVITILVNRGVPMSKRKADFRVQIRQHFDLPSIAKFILARYWKRITPEQQQTYVALFEDAVIENYASQFDSYNNEKLVISGSRASADGGTLVKSHITRPGKGEPLLVGWKVFNTKRGLKVLDVIIDNVSMSISLRNEYSSAIQNRGGIEGLLDYLREKISTDRAKYK